MSGMRKNRRQILERISTEAEDARPNSQDWERDWKEVAFATCLCGVDDGLSRRMDGITISPAKHRRERLKALGNAIVPQVAIEILEAIKYQIEKE
jgi:DNA (cytosine-5)-methyltransferase 1